MRLPLHVIAAILAVLPAASPLSRGVDIPVEEWRSMSEGKTLSYKIDGRLWALEQYIPGTDRVRIQLEDGSCMDGWWEYEAPHYCFHWMGQGTSCFRHVRLDGQVVVVESRDGVDTGMTQDMTSVSDAPLSCPGGTA